MKLSVFFTIGAMFMSNSLLADKNGVTPQPKVFKVAFPSLVYPMDSATVNSASEYFLLLHLCRPLVTFTSSGELLGDLAESWDIDAEFKVFTFKIKAGEKLSDGSPITNELVLKALKRLVARESAVHYETAKIKEVATIAPDKLRITLHKSDPFFIQDLDNPEFRVLSEHDAAAPAGKQSFQVTSGAYFLQKEQHKVLTLAKNQFFPASPKAPELLEVSDSSIDPSHLMTKVKAKDYDLLWVHNQTESFHKEILEADYQYKVPRLSFSYWLSMNPNTPALKAQETRNWLQKVLSSKKLTFNRYNPSIARSNQLYLPNGPGRPPESVLNDIWAGIETSPRPKHVPGTLKILLFKRLPFKDQIVALLAKEGIKADLVLYDNFTEYAELIKTPDQYDIIQANNDFSQIDIRLSLEVTFRKSRPLILTEKGRSVPHELLSKIVVTTDNTTRYQLTEELGKELLRGGYIVPLYYYNVVIYHKKSHDLSNWSQIVPDISIWKILAFQH